MPFKRNYGYKIETYFIDNSMFAIYPSAPKPGKFIFQRFWFAQAGKRMGANIVNQVGNFLLDNGIVRFFPKINICNCFFLVFYFHKSAVLIFTP